MLDDLGSGACSVLEREYLNGVERAHGLPSADRQSRERTEAGVVYRDAEYVPWDVIVEMDGSAFHTGAAHEADLGRDLLSAASSDRITVRLGWRLSCGTRASRRDTWARCWSGEGGRERRGVALGVPTSRGRCSFTHQVREGAT